MHCIVVIQCIPPGSLLTQSCFDEILHSLSDDFLGTLDILQDHLTNDCVCAVVICSDVETANKLMLNCLIENHTQDVTGLCDILENIHNAPNLPNIIANLRNGNYNSNI